MIIPIVVLSAIFVLIGFFVNENNANYLLSGYNTMPEAERKNFDLVSYLRYFKKFHIFLGSTLLLVSLALWYFADPDWSGLFLGTYPLLAYAGFIWRSDRFVKNAIQRRKWATAMATGALLLVFGAAVYSFMIGLTNNEMIVNDKQIEITGVYGLVIDMADLKSVELAELPQISHKIHGFALAMAKKGIFSTDKNQRVRLLLNTGKTPVLRLVTTDGSQIYYASASKPNQQLYREIRLRLPPGR